jgi:hypothetical protein
MLYSVVDDRSGVAYQEYHCVYGEDVEAALRFLFAAMSPKTNEGFPFQGIPNMLYMDSGPIARSQVFQQVMRYLGVEVRTHMPRGKDGRRVTARSKGKVERPFRTVKEMHETLYHLHTPETEAEANAGLLQFVLRYNTMDHRSEPHSRLEDWLQNLPPSGIRAMCSWERFCTFAREPEKRKVGGDARVSVDGVTYEVDPDLAGETVMLWWGLFDQDLYVEYGERRYGPYMSVVRTSWTSQALRLTTRGGQDIVDPWLRRALTPLGSQDLWASNGSMRRSFNIKECTRFQKIARWKQAAPIIFLIEHGQDRG